ncbi:s-formylglutathione [Musa troglodytarum]|uniref:S-formylglutathione n=1 Tax=Musa troglodytarum TaxID=320322 RepID=A0A9E7G2Q9_9LILI|nr:s-formylglutathione [Musa troglodytarum]
MAIAPPFLRVLGCFRPSRLHRFLSTEERLGFRPDIPPPAMEPRRHHPKNGLLFSGLFGLDVILFPLLGLLRCCRIRLNGTFMRHWDRIAVFEVARFLPRSVSAARCRPKGQVLAFVCSSCLCQSEITAFTAPFDALPCSVTALAAFAA